MEKDKGTASTSNMKNDVEQESASDTSRTACIEPITEVNIDVLIHLQSEMESLTSKQNPTARCIYRVPNSIRNVKLEAYSPQLISIGPLHRGNERLAAMEKQKLRYFKEFTERHKMDQQTMLELVSIIHEDEDYIRAFYSESLTEISSRDFLKMILLDAVFIIDILKRSNDDRYPHTFEPWMIFDIREDLILFENQLPFSIIQKIYDKVNKVFPDETVIPFLRLATLYFGKYTFSQGIETYPGVEKSKHFTDLLRNFMLNEATDRKFSFNLIKLKYSAVMLRRAGVKFQVTQDKCLVNIKFHKGVLKMPRLEVDYCFERFVRNIMALEQCYKPREPHICNYFKFMDHLINSAEDVDLLVENGIILNWLGDESAVSNMINKLCEKIGDTYTCYDDICQEMNDHYEDHWNHRKATLKLVYFPNIWRGTATVAATILLILTLVQTMTSIISLF